MLGVNCSILTVDDVVFFFFRCKLFYKKDSEFKEKGVGTLHLKQTADGKTQLIIRADTNLGKTEYSTSGGVINDK